jgi:Transglutaminase-like superfamily
MPTRLQRWYRAVALRPLGGMSSRHTTRLAALAPLEWLDLLRVVTRMAANEVALRVVGLPTTARWNHAPLASTNADPPAEARPEQLRTVERRRWVAVDRVSRRWPWGDTCLRRSLATAPALRHHQPHLRLGVARTDRIRAHSWLETPSFSLGLSPDTDYLPLHRAATHR